MKTSMFQNRCSSNTRKMNKKSNRNRRASASLSPVLVHFVAPHGKLYQRLFLLKQLPGSIPPIIVPQRQTRSARTSQSA